MIEDSGTNLFVYVLIGAAILMGAVWYFLIAPIERRNHERKLAILQDRIKSHEKALRDDPDPSESFDEVGESPD